MAVRGVRGATTVTQDEAGEIIAATRELLLAMVTANGIDTLDLAAVVFTVTDDLTTAFPARAARELGWQQVPLLDAREIAVPGAAARCIRVLALWNTERAQDDIVPIYLRDARALRPDLAK